MANNKGADQNERMDKVVSTFVVHMQQSNFFNNLVGLNKIRLNFFFLIKKGLSSFYYQYLIFNDIYN